MEKKNEAVLKLINDIKSRFETHGFIISEETYQKILDKYLNSEKSFKEIKTELEDLVNQKIISIKSKQDKERLKALNIEDFKDKILTIESLDKYGYPNVINSNLEILSKIDIGHNAPVNVRFGNKNGFYKNSANTSSASLDKFEFLICQIGKMLNIKMAETYKVSANNKPLGIISENVCNIHETLYMYSGITKFINKDSQDFQELKRKLEMISNNRKIASFKSNENEYKIPVAESKEDIKTVIDSFLQVIRSLKINEEEQRNIRKDYFNMIMLDFIVNNVDRNQNNYGLIISEYGSVEFSPLFDNSTIDIPSMPKGYQQINGFLIDKNNLLNSLYTHYYDDIKDITRVCLHNRDSINNKVSSLCTSELDPGEQEWFLGTFNKNMDMVVEKEMDKDKVFSDESEPKIKQPLKVEEPRLEESLKLVRTKPNLKQKNNQDGKINLVMILLAASLVLIVITLIILIKIG